MREAADFENRWPVRAEGVSPGWQVAAIVSLLAALVLLVIAAAFGAALLVQNRPRPEPVRPPVLTTTKVRAPLPRRDEEEEPANPPYPTIADLQPAAQRPVVAEEPAVEHKTARQRFLELGEEIWTPPAGHYVQRVSVSPDGRQIAFVDQSILSLGPLAGPMLEFPLKSPLAPGPQPGQGLPGEGVSVLGVPVWSEDGQYLYVGDSEGQLRRYEAGLRILQTLPFHGSWPVPLGKDRLIFRRSRPTPKVDLPGGVPTPDQAEVVVGDLTTHEVRVLVPPGDVSWTPLAASPDGKWLALVPQGPVDVTVPARQRLFLFDLTAQKPGKPQPVGAPCHDIPAVFWTADSKTLIYAHDQQPPPPDCWESGDTASMNGIDIFLLDTATGRETRLSRGGGFGALSPTLGDVLYFLAWQNRQPMQQFRLHRVSLAAARDFAVHEANLPPRTEAVWLEMLDQILAEAKIPADATGAQLTPAALKQLAEVYARTYRDRFKTDAPTGLEGWDWQQRELRALNPSTRLRNRLVLVLGAVQGEYLCRRAGAAWHLADKPLLAANDAANRNEESPFGLVLNPFAEVRSAFYREDDEDDDEPTGLPLREVLRRAEGRALVLSNDAATGRQALQDLADPNLARAQSLFEQNKGDEADQVLLALVQDKKYQQNQYLVLYVGKLLHDHKRLAALKELMQKQVQRPPPDAHKYNLLGLALLDSDPQGAIAQFRNALRCDLNYGPAYLNLAEAYQKAHDLDSARLCLRRYLRLLPYGTEAADARQRLTDLPLGPPG